MTSGEPSHSFERPKVKAEMVANELAVGKTIRGSRGRTDKVRRWIKRQGGMARVEDLGEGVFLLTRTA